MAARKSCTHFTWAEAKAKVGGGKGPGGNKASKNPPKNVPHNQILAQKIISKQQQSNGAPKENLLGKKSLRKLQREDEKAAAAIAAAKEERERERRNRTVKPFEQAQERQVTLAKTLQSNWKDSSNSSTAITEEEELRQIAENKGMQLDEVMALEAIFSESTEFGVCQATKLEELRGAHETWLEDEDNTDNLKTLVNHPAISFTIQITMEDTEGSFSTNDTNMELAAAVVLHVTLPPMYPSTEPPKIQIHDCMVTDKNFECSPDKPLESLMHLDEAKLQQAMTQEIQGLLPYPCVYEVGVTWLTENIYNYFEMRAHASAMG